jgi:tetratricopeptide (TPR) repeat protein
MTCRKICKISTLLVAFATVSFSASGQDQLLNGSWFSVKTQHFTIISQASRRQTLRFANKLEAWREIAAQLINEGIELPRSNVPNYVYLFDDDESFKLLTLTNESAFFSPTPRANFMAVDNSNSGSFAIAMHRYAHFLIRNFLDLRLPRWYEEGLAGYLARIEVSRGRGELQRFTREGQEALVQLSGSLSTERLLYRDDALASPRVIQIANLKSEALLHYLLHAYEEDDFIDRRENLSAYLQFLLAGRNSRFAFDQAFDVTTEQLEQELHNYLITSRNPAGTLSVGQLAAQADYEAIRVEGSELAVSLAELGLNSGQLINAQALFQSAVDSGSNLPRSFSGLGDSLRMQELEGMDQTIARHFEQALSLSSDDPDILLDYGEYWEAELENCDKQFPSEQRTRIIADIKRNFDQAIVLSGDSPEANLAMAEFYLFEGQDWQNGLSHQEKAFALLPADTFIEEQTVKYLIESSNYEEAERLIDELAQPIHNWGEPDWVSDLRIRLSRKQRGETYDACTEY